MQTEEEINKEIERWKQDKERGALIPLDKLENETKNI